MEQLHDFGGRGRWAYLEAHNISFQAFIKFICIFCSYQYGPRNLEDNIQFSLIKAFEAMKKSMKTNWCSGCVGDFGN